MPLGNNTSGNVAPSRTRRVQLPATLASALLAAAIGGLAVFEFGSAIDAERRRCSGIDEQRRQTTVSAFMDVTTVTRWTNSAGATPDGAPGPGAWQPGSAGSRPMAPTWDAFGCSTTGANWSIFDALPFVSLPAYWDGHIGTVVVVATVLGRPPPGSRVFVGAITRGVGWQLGRRWH
jgi:hypothetical protein